MSQNLTYDVNIGSVMQQAITWANVDSDLGPYGVSQSHNELRTSSSDMFYNTDFPTFDWKHSQDFRHETVSCQDWVISSNHSQDIILTLEISVISSSENIAELIKLIENA